MEVQGNRASSTYTPTGENSWPNHWLPKPWAVALHRKLSLAYLGKFANSFPDQETIDEWVVMWAEGLAGMDGEQIKHGLLYCQRNHEWPPTMGEFIAACKARPKPFVSLPAPSRVDSAEGIKRVANIVSRLRPKVTDGRAYWRAMLDDPTIKPETRRFATEALAILNGDTEAVA